MTQMTTEIETVTVTFDDLKANVDLYYRLKATTRVVVTRDGEEMTVIGRWLPGETKRRPFHWLALLNEIFPDLPLARGRSPGRIADRVPWRMKS